MERKLGFLLIEGIKCQYYRRVSGSVIVSLCDMFSSCLVKWSWRTVWSDTDKIFRRKLVWGRRLNDDIRRVHA